MAYEQEFKFAVDLARQAGDIMVKGLGRSETQWKPDHSPVTEYDLLINQLTIESVQTAYPDDGVLGEEDSYLPERQRKWVVDPIDGTQPFDVGMPLSTYCLALVVDEKPVLGVVYDPYTDRLFSGIAEQGAYLNDKPLQPSPQDSLEKQYVFLSSRMEQVGTTAGKLYDALIEAKAKVFNVRSISYGLMSVAEGRAAAAVAGYYKPWDIAAAQVILQEAGVTLTDFDNQPFAYGSNKPGLLAARGSVHTRVIEVFRAA